jgi:hypothetical protein
MAGHNDREYGELTGRIRDEPRRHRGDAPRFSSSGSWPAKAPLAELGKRIGDYRSKTFDTIESD